MREGGCMAHAQHYASACSSGGTGDLKRARASSSQRARAILGYPSISQYAVGPTGALQALGTPLTVSSTSGGEIISLGGWMSVASGGGYLYLVASSGGAPPSSSSSSSSRSSSSGSTVPATQYISILAYAIQSDGNLTPPAAAPLTLSSAPPWPPDPTGSYAYLPTTGAQVIAVDAGGALTPTGAVSTAGEVTGVSITPEPVTTSIPSDLLKGMAAVITH